MAKFKMAKFRFELEVNVPDNLFYVNSAFKTFVENAARLTELAEKSEMDVAVANVSIERWMPQGYGTIPELAAHKYSTRGANDHSIKAFLAKLPE
jgi:hypothetical protein